MKLKSLTRNLGWKLMSLLVAFALWLTFSGARELTTSMSVPVQYRNIPKNLEISSDIVERVHLFLRGPSPLLSRLTATSAPLVLDLGTADQPGVRTYTLGRGNVNLPAGVVLERTIPGQIQLRLETRTSREVPVEVRFDGPAVAVELSPQRFVIAGPKSRVDHIDRVRTDPLDAEALAAGPVVVTAVSGDAQVNFSTSPMVTVKLAAAQKNGNNSKK